MTRDSEIKEAAAKRHYFHSDTREGKIAMTSFMEGARWADSHPQHIEIPVELSDEIFIEEAIKEDWKRNAEVKWEQMEMYYFNKFLDKACDLLRDLDVFTEDFINDFRKTMKGE